MAQSWQFWAVLSAVFAAATALLAKAGIEGINPDLALFIRVLIIVPVLGLFLAATGQFQSVQSVPGKTWVLLGLSALATGASWLAYFRALKLGPASRVAPVDKLSVVLVALLALLLLGETLPIKGWIGVVLIALGAMLVATA